MKTILLQLARHHEWASKVLFKKLSTLSPGLLNQDINSSFRGINKTLYHLYTAESIWWQRVQLSESVIVPDVELAEDFEKMSSGILKIAGDWIHLVSESNENRLQHVFQYMSTKKVLYKQPLYEALIQVFNHQTYHHGQIITMLRQLNVDRLPATDFIQFVRTRGRV